MEAKLDNLENKGMLDAMYIDLKIYMLDHQYYPNKQYLWKRWLST
jgi:hypothetical protein